MKSVVFIIESLNLGGAETSLVTFLNNIDYNKYKVDLILFTKENFFINYLPNEVNVIYVDFPKMNILERLEYKFFKIFTGKKLHHAQVLYPLIASKLKVFDKEYDIAHAYNQGFSTYYTSNSIKASKKFAWINIDYQKANYQIQFDYPFYSKYTRVIAISTEVERGFLEEVNKIEGNIDTSIIKLFADDIILNIRASEKQEVDFNLNKINIVTVCRLSKQKGLHLAVESCKKLIEKGYSIHWYVVGEGVERIFLEKLVSKYSIQNHFSLLGKTLNPFPYMRACDIYVQTSLFEGWGLTLIEAILLKKLVVTTNFPTAFDIIKHNETGLICEMNSDEIVRNLEKFINDTSLKERVELNLSNRKNLDMEEALSTLDAISI